MSAKSRIIWLVVVALAIFVGAKLLSQRKGIEVNKNAERLAQAIAEASRLGNIVVNARDAVENPGSVSAYDGKEWRPILSDREAISRGKASFCVVFAHGYNTSFAEAVERGNELCAGLVSIVGQTNFNKVKFYSFCWHGDLGTFHFGAADESARNTAPMLAAFLKKIAGAEPPGVPRRIIVVTHSLGARLALEALHQMGNATSSPLVDTLLMIQPAVGVEDLGRGTIDIDYVPPPSAVDKGVPQIVHFSTYTNNGVYFDTVAKTTKRSFVTASIKDGVLSWAFDTWAKGVFGARIVTYPMNRVALGSLNQYLIPGWTFPTNLEILDLSPGQNTQASVTAHSSIFDPKNPELLKFLVNKINTTNNGQ